MKKEKINIGIKEGFEGGFQVWFKIGNQQFQLPESFEEGDKGSNYQHAIFYRNNLKTAFEKTGVDVDVYTSDRLIEINEKVRAWQKNDMVHSLTCGNDSSHKPLVPEISEGQGDAWLVCEDCGFTQTWIPDIVIGD